jgi:hypothetical protein
VAIERIFKNPLLRELGAESFDARGQLVKMRAAPVNLPALLAAPKALVINTRQRFEVFHDVRFVDLSERAITPQAAGEGRNGIGKLKTANDFDGLCIWVWRTWTKAISDDGVHEETAVSREQRPVLILHELEQSLIFCGDRRHHVKSEQPKVTSQFAEMSVGHKFCDIAPLEWG